MKKHIRLSEVLLGDCRETILEGDDSSSSDGLMDEMAIQQFKTVGDWGKRSSFGSEVDRKLLTSPKGVEKIRRQWEKTPYDFDIYLVNDPRVNKSKFREVGLVGMDFVRNEMGLTVDEIPDPDENKITVIYVSNTGAQRFMASGWILAHRLGHAFATGRDNSVNMLWREYVNGLRSKVRQLLSDVYGVRIDSAYRGHYDQNDYKRAAKQDLTMRYVAQQLGTMKSARDGKMRNWYEFGYELLAQYMLTGGIKFNELPESLITGIEGYGRKTRSWVRDQESYERYNTSQLRRIEATIEHELDGILGAAVGSVFVM